MIEVTGDNDTRASAPRCAVADCPRPATLSESVRFKAYCAAHFDAAGSFPWERHHIVATSREEAPTPAAPVARPSSSREAECDFCHQPWEVKVRFSPQPSIFLCRDCLEGAREDMGQQGVIERERGAGEEGAR